MLADRRSTSNRVYSSKLSLQVTVNESEQARNRLIYLDLAGSLSMERSTI